MIIRKNILVTIILILCSCSGKKENQETDSKSEQTILSKIEIKPETDLNNDYSESAELFAREVLKENIRTHVFDITKLEKPNHLRIFKSNGLEKIVAYSNKNYPKKTEPNYYEHFILFVATFNNQENAQKAFDQIKSDSKYGLMEWNGLELELSERVRSLNVGAKPGGMITQNGKQIFSLVKTCRETPIGGTWKDYENKFIRFITRNKVEIEVLNSHCGMDRYKIEKIKASR